MPAQLLESVDIEPRQPAIATVIWLHGLGADGHDFQPIVPQLSLPAHLPIRFIFPHAPMRAVSINNGYRMRAWYDITGMELMDREDEAGIMQSQQQINALIDREIQRGILSQKIVLVGFSQGGAMALYTGLRYHHRLAGIIGLSCYLPLSRVLPLEASPTNKNIPVFMAHGTFDPVVKIEWGHHSSQLLEKLEYPTAWHTYPMEHSVCAQEIKDLSRWLLTLIESN